ncbi:HpaII family restriction endonuclease [Leptospira sp. 96542]|nr:HpaII family restriction endonuclease [Leptospira sp. 96542]
MFRGNKGEWSEVYALLKLLGDGIVYSGNDDLTANKDLFFPIQRIVRNENEGIFEYEIKEKMIEVHGGQKIIKIPPKKILEISKQLFSSIQEADGTFTLPDIEVFLHSIHCYSLKAKSVDKTDIRLFIHDIRTRLSHLLGFSIKSQLGSASTLFNSNKNGTNFKFLLSGEINDKTIQTVNETRKFYEKFEILRSLNIEAKFVEVKSSVFKNNLILIDSNLPEIIGNLVLQFYSSQDSTIAKLTETLTEKNPIRFDLNSGHDFYSHKIKRFLSDIALGFTPGKNWNGKYDANGGYLIVKNDGDIICYHIYDRTQFEDYMFNNTKLDTPSPNRHVFGNIYQENSNHYIDLNLQIRFIK